MAKKDVYICHSKRDVPFVKGLCSAIDKQGISYYTSHMGGGAKDPSQNVADINNSRVIVFIATHNSYRSPFAVKELVYAFNNIPAQNIIVYQADDAKLPENISFTSYKNNIISSDHHLVSSKLIQKICGILNREMLPFDEYELDETAITDNDWLDMFFMFVFPVIGIALSIWLGWRQHSIILAISIFIAAACIFFAYMFATVENFFFKTPMGKFVTVCRYCLSLSMILMIPVSTWLGVRSESWTDGFLWFAGSWVIFTALLVLVNKAESSVAIGRTPLSNRKHSNNQKDLFLCYDNNDKAIVNRIKTELRRNGMTFVADNDMQAEEAVNNSYAFLYIGSRNCYGNERCNQELSYGFNHRRPILAYAVDQTEMPEDKKLTFSNSNVRTITTHPIETTLMSDLKEIVKEARNQQSVKIGNPFWRTFLLVMSNIVVLGIAIAAGYVLQSISLFIAIVLCLVAVVTTISDASNQRRKITEQVPREIVIIEVLMTLSTMVLPIPLWWWISPSPWIAVLLIFLLFASYGTIMALTEELTKQNPVGILSPDQVDNYFDVFISYSRKNTSDADEICELLAHEKLSYFIDRQGIPGGSEFPTVLADAINNCGIFICLMSEDSVVSKFCQQELQYAVDKKLDNDIIIVFKDNDFKESLYRIIENNEKYIQKIKGFPQICKENKWQANLMNHLRDRLPETKQYKSHQAQTSGYSMLGLIRRKVTDEMKNNPIMSVVTVVLLLTAIVGFCFQSWIVALGVYSFLIPLPIYLVTHSTEKAFLESCQIFTFSVWIGMIIHSVWAGVITGFVITLIVTLFTDKSASK